MLSLDLAVDVDATTSAAEIRKRFEEKVCLHVQKFAAYYNFHVPLELGAGFGLPGIALQVRKVGGKLLILMDEYDQFTNMAMFENPAVFSTVEGRHDALNPLICQVFDAVKLVSSICDCRSIVMGITPVASSYRNGNLDHFWVDLSLNEAIGDAFGFSEDDLHRALKQNGLTG